METIIGILGIVASIVMYYAGVRHGRRAERERRAHEIALEKDKRLHALASKMADEYVGMVRRSLDGGVHALAQLGLETLERDNAVREAIAEMEARTGRNPWGGDVREIEGVDLVCFFKYVREHRVNFFSATVVDVVSEMRRAGHLRRK
jgi:hypothetical protein